MPIYEYHCEACGRDFECLVYGSEEPACKRCNSRQVKKLMSTCGFVSRGSAGEPVRSTAGSSCGSCSASSCASCGH